MANATERNIPALLTQAEDCAKGAAQYAAAIGLVHNTEAKIRADIQGVLEEIGEFQRAKTALREMKAHLAVVVKSARDFLMVSRDCQKLLNGTTFNEEWEPMGFSGSLAIPKEAPLVQALLQLQQQFYLANPQLQKADSDVTAERAGMLFTTVSKLRSAINLQKTYTQTFLASRNEKVAALRKRVRGLIGELDQLIDPLDTRWLGFGLNMPGADEIPDVPEDIEVTLITPNTGVVNWPAAARAEYYRVWLKIIGVDEEMAAVGSPADLDFTLEDLPPNSQIQLALSAINSGGESALSEVITIRTK